MNSINFANNLKKLREERKLSKAELARRIGVSDVTVGYWETGKAEPRMGKVEMIANVLGVVTDDLLFENEASLQPIEGSNNVYSIENSSTKVPLYGKISAGIPLEMIMIEDHIEIPHFVFTHHPEAFLLQVNGDSMNKVIPNGSFALIDPTQDVANGDIVAVAVNGYDATLKRFYKLQNTLVLEPDSYNTEYSAKSFDINSEEETTVKVIGKMVWFMSPFNVKY
ncbi:LexA family protein [Paenibacillus sp. FSL H7-0323]|uniref:LexA family protein n=1 Tax=Paenibacillus sp. FSL H7-0323 TaxID=2921433 RepID=UPI0030F65EB0